MNRGQVIYEVNLRPDPSIETEFDRWLEHHVEEMLALPGFVGASIHRVDDPAGGPPSRSVRYHLRDRASLDRYLDEHAARMRAEGERHFGDRFQATRRVLDAGVDVRVSSHGPAACPNCAASLHGQYCAHCGQRARDRMITLWELVKEASEVLTSLDSRLWRTLATLLIRPGRLTRDYLLGRRARYIPALRLFLGLSILFFFLFSIDTRIEVGEPEGVGDGEVSLSLDLGDGTGETAGATAPDQSLAVPAGASDAQAPEEGSAGAAAEATEDRPCENIDITWPEYLQWMNRWLSRERLQSACLKITADHGASFSRALLENIPGMMFLFLPLMAAVMKALYPVSGRYYVEHLLFLVHYHSFFYLLLSLNIALGWVFSGDPAPDWPANVLHAVTAVYLPVYLFRAMRVVYGQRRLLTALKYLLLGVAYFTSLLLFLLGTVTFTAISL